MRNSGQLLLTGLITTFCFFTYIVRRQPTEPLLVHGVSIISSNLSELFTPLPSAGHTCAARFPLLSCCFHFFRGWPFFHSYVRAGFPVRVHLPAYCSNKNVAYCLLHIHTQKVKHLTHNNVNLPSFSASLSRSNI